MILGLDLGAFKLGASPFRTLAEEMPNAPFIQSNSDFVPADGKGLNDLLKSPWMIIHPPALFLGFSLMAVPYCFAMAGLWKCKYREWIGPALPWTLAANLSLFIAVFLGGSIDEQGESVVRPFMKKYEVTYPMYIDTDGTVVDKYSPEMGIPTTYIIGREGNLRYFAVGAVTKKELEPRIKKLLAEEN